MKYTTTLKRLRGKNCGRRGYSLIAKHVGIDFEGEIDLLTILDVCGIDECIWSFKATNGGRDLATAFAIYCTNRVYHEPTWVEWAKNWMSGEDRTAGKPPLFSLRAATAAVEAAAATVEAAAAESADKAVWEAAELAKESVAESVAESAADAAADAAAAESAPEEEPAVWLAAWSAEMSWQDDLLRKMLGGEVKNG